MEMLWPHIVEIENKHTKNFKKILVWAVDEWSAESYATLADWVAISARKAEKGEFQWKRFLAFIVSLGCLSHTALKSTL